MKKTPEIGRYLDDEEKALVQAFEDRRRAGQKRANAQAQTRDRGDSGATMTDERAKISLRVPKRDLTRLKSRALQEGIPYQTLINALIHRYVSD